MSLSDFLLGVVGLFLPTPVDKQPDKVTHIGDKGLDIIKSFETLQNNAYLPTPNDVWTIGYGHTKGVRSGMKITDKQAEDLLREDLDWVEDTIEDLVKVPLNQNQYDAMASLIFNIGRTQFAGSTVLKRINQNDFSGAAEALMWWDKQKGKTLNGLVRRRSTERELFLTRP